MLMHTSFNTTLTPMASWDRRGHVVMTETINPFCPSGPAQGQGVKHEMQATVQVYSYALNAVLRILFGTQDIARSHGLHNISRDTETCTTMEYGVRRHPPNDAPTCVENSMAHVPTLQRENACQNASISPQGNTPCVT